MAQIVIWLKTLIAMVVLAGFLELLLPDNQLKSVTKLILGLAIILFLLRPLGNFYQLPDRLNEAFAEFFFQASATPATDRVVREGLLLRQKWQADFEWGRRRDLEAKLQKALTVCGNILLQRVNCRYHQNQLNRVSLTVTGAAPRRLTAVQQANANRQIIRIVQLVTQLAPGQIEIVWGEG
jgi:stage III sporulation protein AF